MIFLKVSGKGAKMTTFRSLFRETLRRGRFSSILKP